MGTATIAGKGLHG